MNSAPINASFGPAPAGVPRLLPASVAVFALFFGSVSTADAVQICHSTASGRQLTLDLGPRGVAVHLAHGDTLGPCHPPQDVVPYTCSTSSLHYERLFVQSGELRPLRRIIDRTFPSVSAALDFAARRGLSAVEIQVAPGIYGPDSATITRPTRIVGPGRDADPAAELALSIDHRSTHELGIQGLRFRPNGLKPGLTVRTDAAADDPRGHTALCNVGFEQVVGHAVAQLGGAIYASDITVRNTRRHPDASFLNALTGTAFIFGGGLLGDINALLEHSFALDNEGSGIVASGAEVTVALDHVAIGGSQGCAGALFVSNAAEVIGSKVRIGGVRSPPTLACNPKTDPGCVYNIPIEGLDQVAGQPIVLTGNRMYGVFALGTAQLTGTDTYVGIEDLVVRNTSVNGNETEECGSNAASSLIAARGADIAVDQFILDASALSAVHIDATGSIIFDEWFGSSITLSNGIASNNPIGAIIQNLDYDIGTLQNNVLWSNNAVNLDAENVPIPEPERDLSSL